VKEPREDVMVRDIAGTKGDHDSIFTGLKSLIEPSQAEVVI
jgi:hypothetical protein